MTKTDWDKTKDLLARPWPYNRATLLADGYEVTLVLQIVSKDLMHNGIVVYIGDKFEGRWLVEDCEERRRFIPQKTVPVMTRAQITRYNKLPKAMQREFMEYRNRTVTQYATHWTSWPALVKHFEAHNKDIRLKEGSENGVAD